jgi:hypothetical protein
MQEIKKGRIDDTAFFLYRKMFTILIQPSLP